MHFCTKKTSTVVSFHQQGRLGLPKKQAIWYTIGLQLVFPFYSDPHNCHTLHIFSLFTLFSGDPSPSFGLFTVNFPYEPDEWLESPSR